MLSYRIAHILLQRFKETHLNQTYNVNKTISCLDILENLEKSLANAYPNNSIKLTGSDYTYIRPVAASCTSETIGHLLGKSHRTCEDRIKSLYKKFKCKSRRELTELCNYLILTSQNLTLTFRAGLQSNI